ncbi:probable protein phosphatase 1N isoform X2 [Ambystoma mexicanum]|uniref:probable protein phosphatase 1N isoform X2 n=1 Tax=Ambystoma mexicanum TaxID=8296 RepID=UPI0037E7F516
MPRCDTETLCPLQPSTMEAFIKLLAVETEKLVSFFFNTRSVVGTGSFLEKPLTAPYREHGVGRTLHYGLCTMQGWRAQMEDAHTTRPVLRSGLEDWSFFAIYDGHAGSRVAQYCSEHLLDLILSSEEFVGGQREGQTISPDAVKDAIHAGFLGIDSRMHVLAQASNWEKSGSTAVAVLLSPCHLYFINCGDSRALLCKEGQVHFYTEDHKPCNPREKERIQNAGGMVSLRRINGSLAVSRALGDFDYKGVRWRGQTEQLVSPEPEVYEIERSPHDEFLVLACDGVWDTVSNEELCKFVRSRLLLTHDLEEICRHVIDTCLYKGSRDNMSCILVCFPGAPEVSQEAIQREEELNAVLENKVKEIFEDLVQKQETDGIPGLVSIFQNLASQSIPNLPPGGGLASKREVIMAAYGRLREERTGKSDDSESSR